MACRKEKAEGRVASSEKKKRAQEVGYTFYFVLLVLGFFFPMQKYVDLTPCVFRLALARMLSKQGKMRHMAKSANRAGLDSFLLLSRRSCALAFEKRFSSYKTMDQNQTRPKEGPPVRRHGGVRVSRPAFSEGFVVAVWDALPLSYPTLLPESSRDFQAPTALYWVSHARKHASAQMCPLYRFCKIRRALCREGKKGVEHVRVSRLVSSSMLEQTFFFSYNLCLGQSIQGKRR